MPEQLDATTQQIVDSLPADLEREIPLNDNALTVLRRRYLLRGPDGEPVETPAQMFWRVASVVAAPEAEYGDDAAATARAFYEVLTSFRFLPNSPTFTGAGTPLGQLAACFVIPIEDDMGRDPAGIFSTLRVAALIQQTGGGNGFSFSRLRPKGARVSTSKGVATGPVGFLRVYDKAFGEIAQGGTRRGANMAVLRVDHPDILEFIRCKSQEGDITNFNISVGITDEFMRAVEADEEYDLINPQDGQVSKRLRAREVFDEIVKHAHRNGEPGVLFLDAANRSNPVPHLYDLEATNPCLTGDTWITTDSGPLQIKKTVGIPTRLLLNGRFHPTTHEGFFPTGERHTIEITTGRGFRIKVTPNHRLRTVTRMTRYVLESEWRDAGKLTVGDQVVLGDNRQAQWEGKGTEEEGYLLGLLVGDGTITIGKAVISVWGKTPGADAVRNVVEDIAFSMPHRSDFQGFLWIPERNEARLILSSIYDLALGYGLSDSFKGISPEIEQASSSFYRGFLRGFFDADGTVIGSQEKGVSVRLSQSNLAVLEAVQRMLHRLGVISTIYRNRRKAQKRKLPNGKGGQRRYHTRAQHELVISRSNLLEFAERVGFNDSEKAERLNLLLGSYQRALNRERFVDQIVSVTPNGKEPVYDAHVPGIHAFDASGFHVHNCGEQFLGPYENCCLGSVNLAQHATPEGGVDWAKLQETVELATRFLDNVVDANKYVPAVPEIEEAARRARRIGLGIMGLGDLMYRAGIRYGSPEAEEFAAQVVEFVRYHSLHTSVERARERGPFPVIEGSIYDPENLTWRPPRPVSPYTRDFGRPSLDWSEIVQGIQAHGIRNAAQTTVAPTGTIATVSGCEAYGCEPVFALAYVRHFKDERNGVEEDVEMTYTSPLFLQALERAGLEPETCDRIIHQVSLTGSCQAIPEVPEEVRRIFVVANDIAAEEHVRMQAAIQAFVDNSISKCVIGDTLLLTPGGLIPIQELSEMRLPDQFEPLKQAVVSPQGEEMTDAFYYGGHRETRRVRFSYGFTLEGTPNHRIQVLDDAGEVVFKRLDELKIGDVAVLYAGQEQFGRPGQPLPQYSGTFRTNSKSVTFPEVMSEDLAFWLGCITAEGAITQNSVNISNNDVALLAHLAEITERLFGLQGTIVADKRNQVHYLQINSRPLRHWLLGDLRLEAGAANKVLPVCILRAGRGEIAAFLRGLFLDGYMSQDGKLFGITLASESLIRQFQVLLLNMNVLATVRQIVASGGFLAWNLTVQGGELETLAHQISFVEVWKNERLQRRNMGRLLRHRNYSRLLPTSVTEALREMQSASSVSLRSQFDMADATQARAYQRMRVNLLQGHRLERSDAQALYDHLSQDANHPMAGRFFAHDREDRVYVAVKEIGVGFAEVFDVSVPGSHSFIANGLGNHNTINFPEHATPDDVARAYQLAWRLGCKGLTVYVTGSREKVVLETKQTQGAQNGEGDHAEARKPRPMILQGTTYRTPTPLGTAYITINENGDKSPFEVFANVGKAGSDTAAVAEAIGRLISLALRMPSPLTSRERLTEIIDQLSGIGGRRPMGFGPNRVRSLPDAVAQVLARHIALVEAEQPPEQLPLPIPSAAIMPPSTADLCPDCGQAAFVAMEGCRKCLNCGYSEC